MASTSREARRRKIMERGSDRLALITGKIQTLPSTSDSSPLSVPPHQSEGSNHEESQASEVSHHGESQASEVSHHGESQASEANLPREDHGEGFNDDNVHSSLGDPESPLQTNRAGNEVADEAPIVEVINNSEPSPSPSASRDVSHDAVHAEQPSSSMMRCHRSLFNPSELRSAVDYTVNARMLCSVLVALLVVFSYMGFPLIGSKASRSVLMFRPLYLVLLTNITLVIARLILSRQSRTARAVNGESKSSPGDDNDWVNQIGNNLELGYLLMKMMDAVIIDCSLYSAVVVCGMSLARIFT